MYAVTFDLDTSCPGDPFGDKAYNNAYAKIGKFLADRGWSHPQGSVYFSPKEYEAVPATIDIFDLAKEFDWLATCVNNIRLMRVEENNDLKPIVERAAGFGDQIGMDRMWTSSPKPHHRPNPITLVRSTK